LNDPFGTLSGQARVGHVLFSSHEIDPLFARDPEEKAHGQQ
jgi:hypothetical protein